jgi:hypothetical protein
LLPYCSLFFGHPQVWDIGLGGFWKEKNGMVQDHAIPKPNPQEALFHGLRERQKGLYNVEIRKPYEKPETDRENRKNKTGRNNWLKPMTHTL